MIISPEAIIWLFVFGVFIIGLFVIRVTFPNRVKIQDEDRRILFTKIMNLLLIINLGIGGVIILMSILGDLSVNDSNEDITNWVALIVEIGIGIAIGISIYLYSDFQQNKIKQLVTDTHQLTTKLDKMIDEQNRLQTSRKKFLHEATYGNLLSVLTSAYNISQGNIMRQLVLPDGTKFAELSEYLMLDQMLEVFIERIKQFNDIMEPELYASLSTLCNVLKQKGMGESYGRGLIPVIKRCLNAVDTSLFSREHMDTSILEKV